jgi:SLT domain-containing protein
MSANQALAKKMAQQMYGWTGAQWSNGLLPLWTQESHFSATAQNPTSTAYGIAQFLDSTWASYGSKTSNPGLQIKYGLEYIKDRYGNPVNAEAHERSMHWYAQGTNDARKGYAVVGERGPELIKLTGGESIMNSTQAAHVAKQDAKQPVMPYTKPPNTELPQSYAKLLDNGFSLPETSAATSSPAAAAGGGSRSGGDVNLNFNQGSIMLGSGVSQSDVAAFTQQVERAMQSSSTIQAVASGTLHG